MTAQTSYSINQAIAFAGQLADIGPMTRVSRDVEGSAGINFGVVVGRGTDADRQCKVGGAIGTILGVTYRSLEREGAANSAAVKYNEKETAGILQKGYIYAVCPAGCVPGDAVKYTIATGVLDAGAAAAGEASLDEAQWDSTAAAGAIAKLRLFGLAATAGA